MNIVCLDLEGILVPEIWIAFSEVSGIPELRLTTREVPDYDVLMKRRIRILKNRNLKLGDIRKVIGKMEPLEGAGELLDRLRPLTQVIILSDTFDQFARPLMSKLGWPTLFCNTLLIGDDGSVESYTLRQENGKCRAVEAFKSIGFRTFAVGDSYNDVTMLKAADAGVLFRPPDNIIGEFPEFPVTYSYSEIETLVKKFIGQN
jgi:phosphoserine/homoserine phosphotransferase